MNDARFVALDRARIQEAAPQRTVSPATSIRPRMRRSGRWTRLGPHLPLSRSIAAMRTCRPGPGAT